MESDFSLLYSELELQPDCSIDEFKRAYRRRIAELHPDRGESQDTDKLLSRLLALSSSALRFHRRHGRLPGQLPQAPELPSLRADASIKPALIQHASIVSASVKHTATASTRPGTVPNSESSADKPARRTILAAAIFILLLLVLMTIWDDSPPEQSDPGPGAAWSSG